MANLDLQKFASKPRETSKTGWVSLQDGDAPMRRSGVVSHSGFKRTADGVGSTGTPGVFRAVAKPYHPLFSSPDRLQLPSQAAQLNQYWRMFYQMDPVIGGAIDLHGDMPWSAANIMMDQSGGNSKEILEAYEDMLTETELITILPRMTREFFIIGEVFPYMHWDEDEGIFTHITMHNPDYVEVIDSPLVDDDPILTLRPSQEMRRMMQSQDPRYIQLRHKLPTDILALMVNGKNIPLDPINASHIARRSFPYDIRGTSIMSRMFRILMYEDAVFNGQIQQATRHALPLRIFKIGDPATGFVPPPEEEERFANLLAEAEVDPLSAIIYHHALQVEYHGIEGKQLRITQEWDVIERAKLIALGVNRSFLHGETSYASANAGLQVLMMRYRTLRDMFLADWVYKRVFATMAELRGFYREVKKSDQLVDEPTLDKGMERKTEYLRECLKKVAEIEDPQQQAYEYMRLQPLVEEVNQAKSVISRHIPMTRQAGMIRSKVKKKKVLLYPQLVFDKRLDVRQDENILRLWTEMAEKGWVSPRTVVHGAGLDFDTEQTSFAADASKLMRNKILTQALSPDGPTGGGMGGGIGIPAMGAGEGEGMGTPSGAGDEAGEGAGAPGSGNAAYVKSQNRVITAEHVKHMPSDVREDFRTITGLESQTDLFSGCR